MRHHVRVRLDLLEEARLFQLGDDQLARGKAVLADVELRGGAQCPVRFQDVDGLQRVLLAEFVVIRVVRGRDFQRAGTELALHILIEDDGDATADQWHKRTLAFQVCVALIFRVNGDGGVAEDGFWTGGGDGDVLHPLPASPEGGGEDWRHGRWTGGMWDGAVPKS